MNWRWDSFSSFLFGHRKKQPLLEERMAAASLAIISPTTSTPVMHDVSDANGTTSCQIIRPTSADLGPIVTYLLEYFVPQEPILASLNIENKTELSTLLEDIVNDAIGSPGTVIARDLDTSEITGVCLASRHNLFEEQLDRLCSYSFTDPKLSVAIEFLKYVFNRVDLAFHLGEAGVKRPVFIILTSVRPENQRSGLGSKLLAQSMHSAQTTTRCDSAFTMCTSNGGRTLYGRSFGNIISTVRFCDYRGEFREPPITPTNSSGLQIMLAKL